MHLLRLRCRGLAEDLWEAANCYSLLAGTYTPIAYLGLGGATGVHLLRLVWGGAAAGILQMLFLPKAPRLLTTLIYIALGWVILPHGREVIHSVMC